MGPKAKVTDKVSDSWESELNRIVTKLINRRDSDPFREPVPWKELQLLDYLNIVKIPMDLGTVKKKLDKKQYKSSDECAADIRLIWHNSMSYNAPNSTFYNLAKSLSEIWEKEWSSSSAGKNDALRPPSIDDLTTFAENSQRITADDLGDILKILDNECPTSLFKNIISNEVQVNLDLIDGKTFKLIDAYLDGCLKDFTSKRKYKPPTIEVIDNVPPLMDFSKVPPLINVSKPSNKRKR